MSEVEQERNKAVRRKAFVGIPNDAMRDTRLSIEARGMLALLMTFSENWIFRASHIQRLCGVGKDKYQRIIRELKEVGYLTIIREHDEGGRFIGDLWSIENEPDSLNNHEPGNPAAGKQGPLRKTKLERKPSASCGDLFGEGKPPKDEVAKPELKEAFEYYCKVAKEAGWTGCRSIEGKRKSSLSARLSEGGLDGWKRVLDYTATQDFYSGSNDRGWTASIKHFLQPSSFADLLDKADAWAATQRPKVERKAADPVTAQEWLDHFYKSLGWKSHIGTKWSDDRDMDLFRLEAAGQIGGYGARQAALEAFSHADKLTGDPEAS